MAEDSKENVKTLGRKIRICNGSHCRMNFNADLIKKAEDHLGIKINSREKGEILLETTACLSFCEKGPNVGIDNEIFCAMTPQKLEQKFIGLNLQKAKKTTDRNGLESVLDLLQ